MRQCWRGQESLDHYTIKIFLQKDETVDRVAKEYPGMFLDPRAVAKVAVALASGWMDAVAGQIIVVDEGWSHVSPLSLITRTGLPGSFPEGGAR